MTIFPSLHKSSKMVHKVRGHFFWTCVNFEHAMWNNGRPKKEISINTLLNSFLVALVLLRPETPKNCGTTTICHLLSGINCIENQINLHKIVEEIFRIFFKNSY